MTQDDGRVRELFERAVDLPPEARQNFLQSECADDADLLNELTMLLAADEAALEIDGWNRSALVNEALAEAPAKSTTPVDDPSIGETIGVYRLVELIGKGGMGKVYRAVRIDAEFEKSVAVKTLRSAYDAAHVIARFRSERQILASLEHPNIARLLDGGATRDGLPYLIMEFIDGVPPLEFCEQHSLTIPQRLAMFRQVCAAVHYAHQRMVIHRDLKPGNILVTSDGNPKLLDFGIAKVLTPDPISNAEAATETGMQMMTARYSSPEQVRGEPVTTASDVYSLGVILYELLTGQSPYREVNRPAHELLTAVCNEEPPRPSLRLRELRGDLDNIILKALRKNPAERYSSVDQFSEDILRYLEGRPVQARGDGALYVAAKFVRRNKAAAAAAVVILGISIGAFIAVTRARARAEARFNDVRQLAHSVMFDYHDAIERLPGSTPVRARLVKDALHYLDSLSKDSDTPELQREIVEAYTRVSSVQGDAYSNNLGDAAGAMDSAKKAVAAAEKLLEQDRSSPSLRTSGGAFAVLASLLYSAGDLVGADRQYHRSIELLSTAAREDPNDIENGIELSTALRQLGDLYGNSGFQTLGKTAESVQFYRRASDVTGDLSARFPDNVHVAKERYETLLSLAALEANLGQRSEAANDLRESLRQIEKVCAADPNDSFAKVELANVEVQTGQSLTDSRKPQEALPHIARSAAILEQLSAADPRNTMYRRSLGVVENDWAAALTASGDPQTAIAHNLKSVELATVLSTETPNSTEFLADLALSRRKLSDSMLAAGDAKGALEHALVSCKILCTNHRDAFFEANCGRALLSIGNAHMQMNNPAAAVAVFREAEQIAVERSKADPASAIYRSDLGRAAAKLAAALVQVGKFEDAAQMYRETLDNFAILRDRNSLSPEDSHRADLATQGLSAIRSRLAHK
ncbi:MAG TPA: protein kinase [Bryobacteraceae bacterium]|jgi:tetratricopeptide (TPR) repeat protein/tRNA A-37 threonylcarbamoyl transferase component Bud32